jgi:TP53 regulating kinase-like protein
MSEPAQQSANSETNEILLGHGAEARVLQTTFCGRVCVVKERVVKKYRHPMLEASLSKKRLNQVKFQCSFAVKRQYPMNFL